ncbi:MAG: hypothetical protein LPK45_11570, partial [Bacteroidota bacterium]|nr:hypothetical protein [Bacteroidota bacterium]MDX5431745.1 hypothetical protein [Bacteroidota bacterium]MDX5470460.1 hypothetical protein [Bacteroidota bacterium]
ELEKEGIVLTLHVYDTRMDSLQTVKILQKPEMPSMDLMIGPLDPPSFAAASNFSKQNEIPIVSPFSIGDANAPVNPYSFWCSPALESYGKCAAIHLSGLSGKTNVLYLSDGSSTDKSFKKGLLSLKDSLHFNFVEKKIDENFDPLPLLKKGDSLVNIVLVPSDQEKKVNMALRSFRPAQDESYAIQVVGLDTWLDFRDPELEHWEKMQATLITAFYAYEGDSTYRHFHQAFRAKYQIAPGKYALKGYDQMRFFGQSLMAFGKAFPAYVMKTGFTCLGSDYYWVKGSRYVQNQALRRIEFKDYRFTPIP